MTFFIGLVILTGIGLIVVGWLLLKEPTEPQEQDQQEKKSKLGQQHLLDKIGLEEEDISQQNINEPSQKSEKTNFFVNLLKKINLKAKSDESPPSEPLPSLKEFLAQKTTQHDAETQKKLNASVPNAHEPFDSMISSKEEKKIEEEIDSSIELNELKEKYERLNNLLKEKNDHLEKTQAALNNELKNRKDFNKVKDVLEKELKEIRDKSRNIQVELNLAKAESEGYKKRINQLEEKVIKLEKIILEKDKKTVELLKQQNAQKTQQQESPQQMPEQPEKTSEGDQNHQSNGS